MNDHSRMRKGGKGSKRGYGGGDKGGAEGGADREGALHVNKKLKKKRKP